MIAAIAAISRVGPGRATPRAQTYAPKRPQVARRSRSARGGSVRLLATRPVLDDDAGTFRRAAPSARLTPLKGAGFKRTRSTFHRQSGPNWEVVNLQRSQFSDREDVKVAINLGVGFELLRDGMPGWKAGKRPPEHQCHLRTRLGQLPSPAETCGVGHPAQDGRSCAGRGARRSNRDLWHPMARCPRRGGTAPRQLPGRPSRRPDDGPTLSACWSTVFGQERRKRRSPPNSSDAKPTGTPDGPGREQLRQVKVAANPSRRAIGPASERSFAGDAFVSRNVSRTRQK
jgi:hypothetical protein